MNRKGFTLVELVIVISVTGIIAVIAGSILLGVIDAWTFKFNRSDMLRDARLAINRMVREIRTVRDSTSIITASSGQFRFIDYSGSADITYSLLGTNLNRTENTVANLLAENVSSLTFRYYNASGTELPTPTVPANIKRVGISLTLTKNGENVYLQSESMPRNL